MVRRDNEHIALFRQQFIERLRKDKKQRTFELEKLKSRVKSAEAYIIAVEDEIKYHLTELAKTERKEAV